MEADALSEDTAADDQQPNAFRLEASIGALAHRIATLESNVEHRMTAMENMIGKVFDRLDSGLMSAFGFDKRIDRLEQQKSALEKRDAFLAKCFIATWGAIIPIAVNSIYNALKGH